MTKINDYKPPQLAEKWGVHTSKVYDFIRSGELRAYDISSATSKRPQWRIPPDAVIEFEERRRGGKKTATKKRRGRRRRKKKTVSRHFDD